MADGFFRDFRRFFFRGLAAVLPTVLTLAIIIYVFGWLDDRVGSPITHGARGLVERIWVYTGATPPPWVTNAQTWYDYFWWMGFLLALVGIYIFGRFIASLLGRGAWAAIEKGLLTVPVIKQVYPFFKQVTEFLLSEKKLEFSRVVAVQYPRMGVWSVGLVTGEGLRSVTEQTGRKMLTVFVPSTPTPFTGFAIIVPREEVVDLNLTIDQGIRFVVSGGVIVPTAQGPVLAEAPPPHRTPQLAQQVKETSE